MTYWANSDRCRCSSLIKRSGDEKEEEIKALAELTVVASSSRWPRYHWLEEVKNSRALLHTSDHGGLMNDPQICWLYPELYRHAVQSSIYSHIKTARGPWLCVVAIQIAASWMCGAGGCMGRGNVATGHQMLQRKKNKWASLKKKKKKVCATLKLFGHFCVWLLPTCVCVCAALWVRGSVTSLALMVI